MKTKVTEAAGLAAAFVAGMVVATALGGGIAAVGAKTHGHVLANTKGGRPGLPASLFPFVGNPD